MDDLNELLDILEYLKKRMSRVIEQEHFDCAEIGEKLEHVSFDANCMISNIKAIKTLKQLSGDYALSR